MHGFWEPRVPHHLVQGSRAHRMDRHQRSIERGNFLIRYKGYGDLRPQTKVQFLTLLDEFGVPHEQGKQIFGEAVTVIGFEVDTRTMTIRMPVSDEDRERLTAALLAFVEDPSRKHSLRRWQSLLG